MILLLLVTVSLGLFSVMRYSRSGKLRIFEKSESQSLKGVLALLIVAHHVSYYSSSMILSEFSYWGNVVCGCFFFLSGMGLMKSRLLKGESYFMGFLFRHLWKLFTTVFLVAILWSLSLYIIVGKSVSYYLSSIKSGDTFIPNTWFVYVLSLLYLFYYITFGWLKSKRFLYSLLLLLLLIVLYVWMTACIGFGSFWYSSVFAFWMGVFFPILEYKSTKTIEIRFATKYILICTMTIVILSTALYSLYVHPIVYAPFLCTLFPVFLYLTLCVTGLPQNELIDFVGRISYELYVVHGVFLFYLHSFFQGFTLFVIVTAGSVLTSFYLHKLSVRLNQLV